jgi:hypothetical protein
MRIVVETVYMFYEKMFYSMITKNHDNKYASNDKKLRSQSDRHEHSPTEKRSHYNID